MTERVNGIRFDGLHSFYDFGMWIAKEKPDWGNPLPKTNALEVPGMDGGLDMTEANSGEVKFSNRTITLLFSAMVPAENQEQFKARIRNALHGKIIKQIVADESPEWFYTGRATVEFDELTTWKLKIIITVDAAPYAMKLIETKIEMNEQGTAEPRNIQLPAVDNAMLPVMSIGGGVSYVTSWNSDLRLGTKTIPNGLNIPDNAFRVLIVKWSANAPTNPSQFANQRTVRIEDADGHSYQTSISSVPLSTGEVRIQLSDIVSAGVTLNRVYRVYVMGIGGCTLNAEMVAYRYRVWNERKEVVPTIVLESSANSSVEIVVNGESFYITTDSVLYEDIILKQGWNDVVVPIWTDENITNLYMIYREGRL